MERITGDVEMQTARIGAERLARGVRRAAYMRVIVATIVVGAASALGLNIGALFALSVAALGWSITATINDWSTRAQTLAVFISDRVLDLQDREAPL